MKSTSVAVSCVVSVVVAPLLLGLASLARAQASHPSPIDTAKRYFVEAHALCTADNGKLWGVSLCGPIMLIDAPSRSIVASEGDAKGALKPRDGVSPKNVPETVHFPSSSGGTALIGFLFNPQRDGAHPAIVMLPGRAGPYSAEGFPRGEHSYDDPGDKKQSNPANATATGETRRTAESFFAKELGAP